MVAQISTPESDSKYSNDTEQLKVMCSVFMQSFIINLLQLQHSIPDSEGSQSSDTEGEEHWATELTSRCEAVYFCERCSKLVDCQLCPVCQAPVVTVTERN